MNWAVEAANEFGWSVWCKYHMSRTAATTSDDDQMDAGLLLLPPLPPLHEGEFLDLDISAVSFHFVVGGDLL